jgi:transcriptional regulator with XRE-family HTH domain
MGGPLIRTSAYSLAELRIQLGEARGGIVGAVADRRGNLMTQTDLARAVGVTQAHISAIELGKAHPSPSLVARLAAVWSVDSTTVRSAVVETIRRRKAKEPQLRAIF